MAAVMSTEHWENLAEAAYEAYRKKMAAACPADVPLLASFRTLAQHERQAWVAAVFEATQIYVAAAMA